MVNNRKGGIACWLFCCIFYFSQEDVYVKKGVLKSSSTLSPSRMLSKNLSPFYLHGMLEYYAENQISVAGEGYYYLGDLSEKNSFMHFHHALFFGANYHFLSGNNDFFIGFQPGAGITKTTLMPFAGKSSVAVNPLISLTSGYNYFVGKFFHFFIHFRYVAGENIHLVPTDLSDIRLSAGLGFQLNVLKR